MQPWVSPREIARATRNDHCPATLDEVRTLRHLLRLCASRGLGLVGLSCNPCSAAPGTRICRGACSCGFG